MPKTTNGKVKAAGAASKDLGNSEHCDVNDYFRSWACWVMADPTLPEPRAWYLLFPAVGLCIRLVHGALVSWDGRFASHCTCVQLCDPRVSLLAFFVGPQRGLVQVAGVQEEFAQALEARTSGGVLACIPVSVGDDVWVRVENGAHGEWRRVSGVVASQDDVGVSVKCADGVRFVAASLVASCVVRAGAITRAGELAGATLVGKRVRVFWPEEDRCFDGVVTAFDGVRHCVTYDDGEEAEEVLPSEDTPHYRVL